MKGDVLSHFFVVAIVPRDADDVKDAIAKLMEPYNENIEAPEYEKPCYCIGFKARDEAHGHAWPDPDEIRNAFNTRHKDDPGPVKDKAWQEEEYKPRDKVRRAFLDAHPLKDSTDPNCEECNGTGIVMSTYNPKSKWDWYRIGGRWDGEIQKVSVESKDGGFNFGDDHTSLTRNSAPVGFLIEKNVTPFAVVTPDGEWHERGTMGWWGIVTLPNGEVEGSPDIEPDEDHRWIDFVKELFSKYLGHHAVGLDCHI